MSGVSYHRFAGLPEKICANAVQKREWDARRGVNVAVKSNMRYSLRIDPARVR
jgi:hypothetical protein